jgi:predicted transcriptional regulator
MHVDVDFLRRLRRQRRLSLGEAATLLGRSRTTIWRYENGRVNMPSEMLLRLAEFYGVSLEQLTTDKNLP